MQNILLQFCYHFCNLCYPLFLPLLLPTFLATFAATCAYSAWVSWVYCRLALEPGFYDKPVGRNIDRRAGNQSDGVIILASF